MYPRAAKVIYTLTISLLLLVWLEHKSINFYWQQAYHSESPTISLEQSSLGQQGAQINHTLLNQKDTYLEKLNLFHEKMIGLINDDILMVTTETQTNTTETPPLTLMNNKITEDKDTSTILTNGKVILTKNDKVFFVGDSMMQGIAPHVRNTLFKEHNIESIDLSRQSTGLAYTQYFNWPQLVKDTFETNPEIKLLVVFLGPNDPWDIPAGKGLPYIKFKSPEWEDIYRTRIKEIIQTAKNHQAQIIWLGVSNMKKIKLNDGMLYLNSLYLTEAEQNKIQFIPTKDIVGNKEDQYTNFVQVGEKNVKVRVDDGIHFTIAGQQLIAQKVLSYIHVESEKSPDEKQIVSNNP